MRRWLAFGDRRQERQWELKFAADQAGLDAAVSLQTLLFPSLVARTLLDQLGGGRSTLPALEALWLAVFLGWALLHLVLAQLSPSTYLRYRTHLVLLSRLQRHLTILQYASLFNREAMGLAGPVSAVARVLPTSLGGLLGMLLWRPGSIASLLSTYALPLKYTAPCALLLLGPMLHSTARQCAADCRGGVQAQVAQVYSGLLARLHEWLPPWLLAAGSSGGGGSSSSTCAAVTDPGLSAGSGGTCAAGSCLGSCVAVHAWLQIVLGALLPLAVMWAVEERSRLRFQQQWVQHHVAVDDPSSTAPGPAGSGSSAGDAGSTPQPAAAAAECPATARPIPGVVLTGWLVTCAWGMWLLLEAVLL